MIEQKKQEPQGPPGMICPRCKGEGFIVKTDIMKASVSREQCPDCKGLGQVQGDISDGLKVKPEPGQLMYFTWFYKGKPRSVMTTAVEGIAVGEVADRYLIVKIMQMTTKPKYRKKGFMGNILEKVKLFGQGQTKYIITSWFDSSEEGKKYLLKRDFTREGNVLIWRRDGKPNADGGQSSTGGDPGNNKDNKD